MGLFPFTFASAAVRPATIDRVKALMWGLVWFIFATIFIWYFRTVPTSTVTVDVSGYVPLSTVLLLHAAVWIVSGAVVYALAAVVGESVGLVETLSRVLFARAPIYLLLAPLAWRGFRVPFFRCGGAPKGRKGRCGVRRSDDRLMLGDAYRPRRPGRQNGVERIKKRG